MDNTRLVDNTKITSAISLMNSVQHDLMCYQQDYVNAVEFIQHAIDTRNTQYTNPKDHIHIEMNKLYDMSITELLHIYRDISMNINDHVLGTNIRNIIM